MTIAWQKRTITVIQCGWATWHWEVSDENGRVLKQSGGSGTLTKWGALRRARRYRRGEVLERP